MDVKGLCGTPPPQPEYGHEPEGQTEPWKILSNFKVF